MAAAKETPRQRMIAMMYLVLTALLALNVSKEVIDAFLVVNESVERSNDKLSEKIENTYATFKTMYQLNQIEVKPFWDRALSARKLSQNMSTYICNIKEELIAKTEGMSLDSARFAQLASLRKKDNYSITTEYFMGDSFDGAKGKSRELKNEIINYRQQMINLVDSANREKLKLGLITDSVYYNTDGKKQNWEAYHFYHTILAADITILNKFITEVYDAEFDVVNLLMDEINAADFSYDKIEAKLISGSDYVFYGDEYKAEVIVAAYDTSQSPVVYLKKGVESINLNKINQAQTLKSSNGKTIINLPANKLGINKFAGLIGVKTTSGDVNYFPFKNEYIVARPSVNVAVEEMNVLYIGVENTISVSVSGIPIENITTEISFGTIYKSNVPDKWIVSVPPGKNQAIIVVMATIDGQTREMGAQRFRIKRLPDPVATIANKREGYVNREILIAAGAIVPKMPGDFGFQLYFEITSFTMRMQRGFNVYEFKAKNGLMTDEMLEQIEVTNRGQSIIFEKIKAIGPYGDERILSPIILTIN